MENLLLFSLLLDSFELLDRQTVLIHETALQRDLALDIATKAVAQMKSAKLLMLADHIDTREDFDQDIPVNCVIGIGLKLVGRNVTGFRDKDKEAFSDYYGLTASETDALFWAQYGNLFPDESNHDTFNLYRIERGEVTRILRRLARR